LPALRDRKEDKVPLAQFLLDKLTTKYERNTIFFNEKALEQIEKHAWNGNIREMENRIERAVILCENNTITAADLDLEIATTFDENSDDIQLSDIEKLAIEKVLVKNEYNISKSAEELGLSRASLYRRMEKYGIENN
jgi:DNA-binding NtrC family response regulator